jgi:hypothetical protein
VVWGGRGAGGEFQGREWELLEWVVQTQPWKLPRRPESSFCGLNLGAVAGDALR